MKAVSGYKDLMCIYTIDGKWKMIAKVLGGTVIAWKPFPEPYKEN